MDFISNLAKEDNQNYCLAYTLTGQDFSNGTIGAAWTGVPKSNVGICARENNSSGTIKTYNTGFITIVNEKCRLTNYQIKLAFAHEVGHSFGALHDQNYDDDERCSPSYFKGGDFLMSKKLGDQKFNGSICGNGIVEPGEECDCGYFDECLESCCYWADYQVKNKRCKLKGNSVCSPSQGECCGPECNFKDNSTTCGKSIDKDCNYERTCSGRSVNCPFDDSKLPDYSMCSLNTSLCIERKCQSSLCEKFNMTKCSLNESSEETSFCHLACQGELTKNVCTDSFQIPEMINHFNPIDLELKTGSKCLNDEGYCDKKKLCQKIRKKNPQKWQIVGLLKSGDKKQNEIAKLLGVSPKCVSSTKKRYEDTGSVSDRSRSGRPRKLT
ncbi:disintegrin and metallo ase domain-containing 10-like [Brachionus plicatilis]|uniref:ADAM10 endopeptidase n=1 Tax=Brachionus plicatilis TaxID=10195 RepID=A0A3M7P3H9_BRAPC|nr:disintegrin and metallo ase domain-containing 10-like [Brachionus plicatilis]